jgi:hypothetical protein
MVTATLDFGPRQAAVVLPLFPSNRHPPQTKSVVPAKWHVASEGSLSAVSVTKWFNLARPD